MDRSNIFHVLVLSVNHGRYALDDARHGADLSSDMAIAILLGGQWIPGRVEYSHERGGYYFTDDDGNLCGLCAGMKVKRT